MGDKKGVLAIVSGFSGAGKTRYNYKTHFILCFPDPHPGSAGFNRAR